MTVFDQCALEYDQWFDDNPSLYQAEINAVRRFIPSNSLGVEIGVGSGRFAAPLGIWSGVEPSHNMAEIAARRGIAVCQAIGEWLPFSSSGFDFVLLVTVICFVDNPVVLLKETSRVLRPEGRLILGFIDKNSPLGQRYEASKENNPFYREAHFYSTEQVSSFVRLAGFEKVTFCQTILGHTSEESDVDQVLDGYGEGAFIVLNASKG